jgi:hypothetical protein
MNFSTKRVKVPNHDCDVILTFSNGKEIHIQCRPSNADEGYKGSFDIILPENMNVICWEGDDMEPSKATSPNTPEQRFAKQLVTELP